MRVTCLLNCDPGTGREWRPADLGQRLRNAGYVRDIGLWADRASHCFRGLSTTLHPIGVAHTNDFLVPEI